MTAMTGSLFVRALDSDTTVFSVDQSGSVYIGSNLSVSGAQTFTGGLIVNNAFRVTSIMTAASTAYFSSVIEVGGTIESSAGIMFTGNGGALTIADAVTTIITSAESSAIFTGGVQVARFLKVFVNGSTFSMPLFNRKFTF